MWPFMKKVQNESSTLTSWLKELDSMQNTFLKITSEWMEGISIGRLYYLLNNHNNKWLATTPYKLEWIE